MRVRGAVSRVAAPDAARSPTRALARVGRRQVELLDVLLEHARRREAPDVRGDGRLHQVDPGLRQALRVALVPARHDLFLEDAVEVGGIGGVLGLLVVERLAAADGPAVGAVPAFVPPAVEDRDVDDAVGGRLHAARAGRFERPARVVQPDVDALHEVARDAHVVVLEDEGTAGQPGRLRALEDVADDALPGPIGGMRLAREDDLDRALLVPQQPRQPLLVAEQERRSLVGREAAGEADGQDVRVEHALDALERGRRGAVTGELSQQPAAREDGQLPLLARVRLPELLVRDGVEALPESAGRRSRRSGRRARHPGRRRARPSAGPARSEGGCRW